MITFALYTILFWLGTASLLKLLHSAIQQGNILGGWQKQLIKLSEQGHNALHNWLGGCELCTSAFFSFLSIAVYMVFMYELDLWAITGWVNIIWLVGYWSIGTVTNLYFLIKLFEKK